MKTFRFGKKVQEIRLQRMPNLKHQNKWNQTLNSLPSYFQKYLVYHSGCYKKSTAYSVWQIRQLLPPSQLLQDLPYYRITNLLPREFFQPNAYFAIKEGRRSEDNWYTLENAKSITAWKVSEYREIEPEQTLYLDSVAILDDKTIQLKSGKLRIWWRT